MIDQSGRITVADRNYFDQHPYGQSRLLYDQDKNKSYVFVPIPKNASSWIKACFKNGREFHINHDRFWNFENAQEEHKLPNDFPAAHIIQSDRTFVVAMRDPVSRWITAVAQIMSDQDLTTVDLAALVCDPLQFVNDHVEPQISYLDSLPFDRIKWFWVDHRLLKNLHHWAVQDQLEPIMRFPNHLHDPENSFQISAKKGQVHMSFISRMTNYVKSDRKRERAILRAYANDVALIKHIRQCELFHSSKKTMPGFRS